MSQKVPVGGFKRVENTSQFSRDYIKTLMKIVMEDFSLKLMFNIQKNTYSSQWFTLFA